MKESESVILLLCLLMTLRLLLQIISHGLLMCTLGTHASTYKNRKENLNSRYFFPHRSVYIAAILFRHQPVTRSWNSICIVLNNAMQNNNVLHIYTKTEVQLKQIAQETQTNCCWHEYVVAIKRKTKEKRKDAET